MYAYLFQYPLGGSGMGEIAGLYPAGGLLEDADFFNVMNVLESVSEGKNGVMPRQDDRTGNGKVVYCGSQAWEEETDSPVANGGAFVTEPHGGIEAESRGGEETGEREEAAAENQGEGLGLREQEQILEGRQMRGGFIGKDLPLGDGLLRLAHPGELPETERGGI